MLQAIGLSKNYNGRCALENLDLCVEPGQVFCLLGANGAGKTTTINLFLNFVAPSGGVAEVAGLDVTKHPLKTKEHLAYIPEHVMLYRHLSGLENLEYFSGLSGHKHSRAELEQLLVEAGLPAEATSRRVSEYSKGMRQKVGIAVAVAKNATALLLDEPTSGLDPKASNEFSALLQRLSSQGVAILMATHDLFRAKESGTHIGIMREGQLLRTLRTDEVGHAELEQIYLEQMRD